MSESTLESKLEDLENTVVELSETLIKTASEFNKLETSHKELKVKFGSFAKAFLHNSDKELSQKVFKEYQKNMFKSSD